MSRPNRHEYNNDPGAQLCGLIGTIALLAVVVTIIFGLINLVFTLFAHLRWVP